MSEYIKLCVTANNGANIIQFADLNFYDNTNARMAYPSGTTCTIDTTTFSGEGPENILDNNADTKVCGNWQSSGVTVTIEMPGSSFLKNIRKYNFCTANDEPTRDPKSWTVEFSFDGTTYEQMDSRSNVDITSERKTQTQKWDARVITYKSSGTAVYTVTDYEKGDNDRLSWVCQTPVGTSITMYTKVNNGSWRQIAHGGLIQGLPDGTCTLSVKAELATTDNTLTPTLSKVLVTSEADKKVLVLTSAIPNFSSAIGNMTVSYDGTGGLRGVGGPSPAFTGTFTPRGLTWKGHQNDEEHIEMTMAADVDLLAVTYHDAQETEHIEMQMSATVTLIDIHDL